VAGFNGGKSAVGCAFAGSGGGLAFVVVVNAWGRAFARTDYNRFGYFFFGHSFAADLAFLSDLLQAVFAGHSGDSGN